MSFNEVFVQSSTVSSRSRVRLATTAPAPARLRILPEGSILPFVLVVVLFFIWGMSNNLTDILVQQFRKGFNLSQLQAQMVQSAVFFGYFCMALPAALLMRRWGYKAGIIVGLCTFGVGTLLFWPAAVIGQYGPFLLALYVVGCGSAMLETAANPLVAQMGSPETSERRLNLAQAFNPPGTITGVLVGTYFIFSGVELAPQKVAQMKAAGTYAGYLHGEIMRVVPTYVGLGSAVLLWALVIGLTRFPAIAGGASALKGESVGSFRELKAYPHLWLAVVAQFFYVGAQVTTWSAFIPYMKQYTAVTEREAGWFLTGNLVLLLIGRFASTWLMRWIRPVKMIAAYAIDKQHVYDVCHRASRLCRCHDRHDYKLLHVHDVSDNLRAGSQRPWSQHETRGRLDRNVSSRRSCASALYWGRLRTQAEALALGYIVVVAAYVVILGYCLLQGRDVSLKSIERVPEVL